MIMMLHLESNRPSLTGISGPPQSATASAPATAIKSAHDTISKCISKFDKVKTEVSYRKQSCKRCEFKYLSVYHRFLLLLFLISVQL